MSLDSAPPALCELIEKVYVNYAALMRLGRAIGQEHLGGKLLYAGKLDGTGRTLAIAGNIAGAATLAASADSVAGKQAMREGVVDFLVTDLDEALRILKNQIRKREPVAVCVGRPPEDVEREMLERGVLPDLMAAGEDSQSGAGAEFVAMGARCVETRPLGAGATIFTVEIPAALTRESARIEEIMATNAEGDFVGRRWLRLSPRYLGPGARRVRSVVCDESSVPVLRERLEGLKSDQRAMS